MDATFTRGPARRPAAPMVNDPLLQWATGLPTADKRIYAGWFSEVGRDEAFDRAMEQACFAQIDIRHSGGNVVRHWEIKVANLFVIAEGVQTFAEIRRTEERYGIALGWRIEKGRRQSVLRLRGLLQELAAIGYLQPVQLSVKSTLTDDMLAALTRQYEVLDAIDAFRAGAGKSLLSPPYYACSIPLCASGADVVRGSGGQSKEITPPIACIPTVITRDYVLEHWIKREWTAVIEDQYLDATIAWSIAQSQAITLGEEDSHANP